jgi:DNA-binding protein HU-beta
MAYSLLQKQFKWNTALCAIPPHVTLVSASTRVNFFLQELPMNKADLVRQMAQDAGISQDAARKALEGMVGAISGAIGRRERVSLVGFGTFSVVDRKARNGRNPGTGKAITIPAKKLVKFKAGAALVDLVNNGG